MKARETWVRFPAPPGKFTRGVWETDQTTPEMPLSYFGNPIRVASSPTLLDGRSACKSSVARGGLYLRVKTQEVQTAASHRFQQNIYFYG